GFVASSVSAEAGRASSAANAATPSFKETFMKPPCNRRARGSDASRRGEPPTETESANQQDTETRRDEESSKYAAAPTRLSTISTPRFRIIGTIEMSAGTPY